MRTVEPKISRENKPKRPSNVAERATAVKVYLNRVIFENASRQYEPGERSKFPVTLRRSRRLPHRGRSRISGASEDNGSHRSSTAAFTRSFRYTSGRLVAYSRHQRLPIADTKEMRRTDETLKIRSGGRLKWVSPQKENKNWAPQFHSLVILKQIDADM